MRIRGTVKWFNDTKGYGFLRRDDGQSDCFVHHSDIQAEGYRSLQEGERVEFDVIDQPKGPKASNVTKVDEAAPADASPAAEASPSADASPTFDAEAPAIPAEPTGGFDSPSPSTDDSEE